MIFQGTAQPLPLPVRPRRRTRAGEVLLADTLEREARAPLGRIAVVVRLSRLPPPGARPYHRRIARALLEDCAQRHGGQVVALATGDLVLIAPPEQDLSDPSKPALSGPLALPALLLRLLQVEDDQHAGSPEPIAEAIPLVTGSARLHALLADADATEGAAEEEAPPRPRNIFARRQAQSMPATPPDSLGAALHGDIVDLLALHTAVRLPIPAASVATPIRPVHRALRIVPALLAARLATPTAAEAPDPWLRHHLAQSLAEALLVRLRQAWGGATPLDATPRRGVPPLLLALPPAVINGPGFAAFAAMFPTAEAMAPRIAITLAEASADPTGFAAARARLRAGGMALVLDGLSHHALLLARPEALEPDLIALPWSAALLRLPEIRRDELAEAVRRIGPARVLLTEADTEAALRWGRAAGIQLFQGRHAEAMLAASRLMQCAGARGGLDAHGTRLPPCQLRACAERGTAATLAGRTGCTNPRLLDLGVPDPVQAVAAS